MTKQGEVIDVGGAVERPDGAVEVEGPLPARRAVADGHHAGHLADAELSRDALGPWPRLPRLARPFIATVKFCDVSRASSAWKPASILAA